MNIKDIRNSQFFQDFCQQLLAAEFEDFQEINDSRGDGGNDGYIPSMKRLFAIYCPENHPINPSYYKQKIKSDLEKAVNWSRVNNTSINDWVFITPNPLSNELNQYLITQANEKGIKNAFCWSEKHLTHLFVKHSYLHKLFPTLRVNEIEEKLNAILDKQTEQVLSLRKKIPQGFVNPPRERNNYFVEQGNIFERLDAQLKNQHLAYLYGINGLGKTTTVIEYAYEKKKNNIYDFIFYILATDLNIETEMAILADFYVENITKQDTPQIKAKKLKHYLEETDNWLVIFDNLESEKQISEYFPLNPKGHVLYTCNEELYKTNNHQVFFEQFSQEEAELFIYKKVNKEMHVKYKEIDKKKLDEIKELINVLGRLPLTLNIAGAYLRETRISYEEYINLLKKNIKKHLTYKTQHEDYQFQTIFDAFSISLKKISEIDNKNEDEQIVAELSVSFLNFCGFCSPEDIPEEIIKISLFQNEDFNNLNISKEILFREIVALLKRFDLIRERLKPFKYKQVNDQSVLSDISDINEQKHWKEIEIEINVFDIYRTLQNILYIRLKNRERKSLTERIINTFNDLLPDCDFILWEIYGKYVPHVFEAIDEVKKQNLFTYKSWRICNEVGFYLDDIAQYVQAEHFYKLGKTIAEYLYKTNHEDLAKSYNNLGLLYQKTGKFDEAEILYEKALSIRLSLLGENHQHTAQSYDNLALLYKKQGRYKKAEQLYLTALTIRQNVLGEKHTDTATSYNNLGALYYSEGKYEEAESLYKCALEIDEEIYGIDHPDTAMDLNNLAEVYEKQCRYDEAETFYTKALFIRRKVLGDNHPHVAVSYNNFGSLYKMLGKYKDAEDFYKKALAIDQEIYGETHHDTAEDFNDLGEVYELEGKYDDAENNYLKSLSIREEVLGHKHPHTAESYGNLGRLYWIQGENKKALDFTERALKVFQETFNKNNVNIKKMKKQIANIKNSIKASK